MNLEIIVLFYSSTVFLYRICHSQSREQRKRFYPLPPPRVLFFITRIHTFACKLDVVLANVLRVKLTPLRFFFLLQYVGSFPVAGADQSARAEYVRSKLLQLRVSFLFNIFGAGKRRHSCLKPRHQFWGFVRQNELSGPRIGHVLRRPKVPSSATSDKLEDWG